MGRTRASKISEATETVAKEVVPLVTSDLTDEIANQSDVSDSAEKSTEDVSVDPVAEVSSTDGEMYVSEEKAARAAGFYLRKREKSKERYAKNPEKSREYNKERRAKLKALKESNPDEYNKIVKPVSEERKEKGRVYARERYQKNREASIQKQRLYRARRRAEYLAFVAYSANPGSADESKEDDGPTNEQKVYHARRRAERYQTPSPSPERESSTPGVC